MVSLYKPIKNVPKIYFFHEIHQNLKVLKSNMDIFTNPLAWGPVIQRMSPEHLRAIGHPITQHRGGNPIGKALVIVN